MKRFYQILMCCLALLLVGCNLEGVAAFSPNNDRVAIVSKIGSNYHLDTADSNGANPVKIEDSFQATFDVTFDPLGTRLLYVANSKVCTADPVGGSKSCPVTLSGSISGGFHGATN